MSTEISFQSSPIPYTLNMTFRNADIGWLENEINNAMLCLEANGSRRLDSKHRKLTTRGNLIGMGKKTLAWWNHSGSDTMNMAVKSPEVAYELMVQYYNTGRITVYDRGSMGLLMDYVREYVHRQMEEEQREQEPDVPPEIHN
ncbi:hypothetical protein HYX09_01570 [Candidatus Woesearchaeota archaeon]|nr:hypothetical protein [Candidatus Woesearchaeota archaeon]MBI2660936.1 hypothetical protein [Candidatus Woesearchaeota archaeon]